MSYRSILGIMTILIHACARIATCPVRCSGFCRILIHVCARIATVNDSVTREAITNFNSCMREDCNSFLFCSSVSDIYFNSCMREDCNIHKAHMGW